MITATKNNRYLYWKVRRPAIFSKWHKAKAIYNIGDTSVKTLRSNRTSIFPYATAREYVGVTKRGNVVSIMTATLTGIKASPKYWSLRHPGLVEHAVLVHSQGRYLTLTLTK